MATQFPSWGSAFERLAAQMSDMLKEMQSRQFFRSAAPHAWSPRINLYESSSCFFVCAELAGVVQNEIDVQVHGGVLRIRGDRHKPALPQCPVGNPGDCNVSVHLMEIDSGSFERQLALPDDVLVDQITATHRQGYLWIMLPRASRGQNP